MAFSYHIVDTKMAEQLMLPTLGGDVVAQVHMVSELGAHDSLMVHGLGETSLEAVRDARDLISKHATYRTIHRVPHLAWVDFPQLAMNGSGWAERMRETTYVTIGREQRGAHRYSFCSAQELLHEGSLPDYTIRWLRAFILNDRPHPPKEPNRTNAIRGVTTLLPELSERASVRLAVQRMPSLKEHYRQFGYRFKD